jgi:photosystem II stability/assembly factor-like uncharacterized protein
MWFPIPIPTKANSFRAVLLALTALAFLSLYSCDVSESKGRVLLQIESDTAWAKFDTLVVTWKGADSVPHEIFRGPPATLAASRKFYSPEYHRQAIVVSIVGIKDKRIAYREVRNYDHASPDATTKRVDSIPPDTSHVIITPDTLKGGGPGRPRVQLSTLDTLVSIGDTVAFTGNAVLDSGRLVRYAWDLDGDGVFGNALTADGQSIAPKSSQVYAVPGLFPAAFRATSNAESTATATLYIHVILDPPKADAGPDQSIAAGGSIALKGKAHDSLGTVTKTEWKLVGGAYAPSRPETTIVAPLAAGDVEYVLRVTDDDGLMDTDRVVVHVLPLSESFLTGLTVSGGKLDQDFNPTVVAYKAVVPYTYDSVTVTPEGAGTLAVNGSTVASGKASSRIAVAATGETVIAIAVQEPGKSKQSYAVSVSRGGPDANADLASLVASGHDLNREFKPDSTSYFFNFLQTDTASTFTLLTKPASAASIVSINGQVVTDPSQPTTFPAPWANTTFNIVVKAESGALKTYVLSMYRNGSGDASLASLTVSFGSGGVWTSRPLLPAFDGSVHDYIATCPSLPSEVKLYPGHKSGAAAKVKVNGAAVEFGKGSAPIAVSATGPTLLTVDVLAPDGVETARYTVQIGRKAATGYLVGRSALLKTVDEGENWLRMKKDTIYPTNDVFFTDLEHGFAVGGDNLIARTTDEGVTWNRVSRPETYSLNSIFFVDRQTGYAAGGDGVILSTTNGGATWSPPLVDNIPNTELFISIFFPSPTTGFAAGGPNVYKTTDGGLKWSNVGTIPLGAYGMWFTNSSIGYAVNQYGGIVKTTDGGVTWTDLRPANTASGSNGLRGIRFLNANVGFAYGESGVVLKTTNAGAAWTDVGLHEPDVVVTDMRLIDANNFWALGTTIYDIVTLWKTKDGGITWQSKKVPVEMFAMKMFFFD